MSKLTQMLVIPACTGTYTVDNSNRLHFEWHYRTTYMQGLIFKQFISMFSSNILNIGLFFTPEYTHSLCPVL